ncbi:MAG: hypothetical protein Q4E73_03010 [Lachnospiraceae bacterium]|nr:hypothetical protein [Lachnospiraceae bacterium]
MKKKQVTLYNMLFPIWLIWMIPLTGIFPIVLIGNFVIDSLVIYFAMKFMKVEQIKENYKRSVLRIWIMGFLADVIGMLPMLFLMFNSNDEIYESIGYYVCYNPLKNPAGFFFVIVCIVLAGICIYGFNKKIALKKTSLNLEQKKKAAIAMAVITAPYLYLLPFEWVLPNI